MVTLVAIPGGALNPASAASWLRMNKKAGRSLRITSAYRSPERQQVLYENWVNRVSGYNFALPPDKSAHVKGIAVDTPEYAWMEANARAYGWIRTDPNERWHYEYRIAYDTHINDAISPTSPVYAKPEDSREDDSMVKFMRDAHGTVYCIGPVGVWAMAPDQWQTWQNLGYSLEPGASALEDGPMAALISSLGGLKGVGREPVKAPALDLEALAAMLKESVNAAVELDASDIEAIAEATIAKLKEAL